MGLSIDPDIARLAAEVAALANETEAEAIRRALEERRAKLQAAAPRKRDTTALLEWLEREVWPTIPPDQLGRTLTREEEDEILGFGPEGY